MASADCNANMTQSSFVIVRAKTLSKVKEVIIEKKKKKSSDCGDSARQNSFSSEQ